MVLAGNVAILPCNFSDGDDFQSVEWSKKDLKPDVVLLYREGKEEHGMKNSAFRHRTSLISPELSDHNFSLRIADVQPSDEGNYTCKSISNNRQITTVWLLVGMCIGTLEVKLLIISPRVCSQLDSKPSGRIPTSVTRDAEFLVMMLTPLFVFIFDPKS